MQSTCAIVPASTLTRTRSIASPRQTTVHARAAMPVTYDLFSVRSARERRAAPPSTPSAPCARVLAAPPPHVTPRCRHAARNHPSPPDISVIRGRGMSGTNKMSSGRLELLLWRRWSRPARSGGVESEAVERLWPCRVLVSPRAMKTTDSSRSTQTFRLIYRSIRTLCSILRPIFAIFSTIFSSFPDEYQ